MDKKDKVKAGLHFGLFMSVFFFIQSLLTNDSYTIKEIALSLFGALLSGALSGALFGWIVGRFVNSKFLARGTKIVTGPGEHIVFETGANYFKGFEGVGGKLYLTNKRLVFQPHSLNLQRPSLSIDLEYIKKTARYKTIVFLNNGLAVTTGDNTEKFVVQKPDEWAAQLTGNTTPQELLVQ